MNQLTSPSLRANSSGSEPTLLVFTLGASWEARRRSLLPETWRKAEQALHRTCLDEILAAGRELDFRLKVSSPATALKIPSDAERLPQSGKDFGTRIRRAWTTARSGNLGAPTVLVGSDVPGLGAKHLRQTLDALAEDPARVVIGPSPDGGFYLLAATQPLDHVLASVCWCSRDTLKSLRQALERDGYAITELEPLRDLDRRSDLEALLANAFETTNAAWRQLLRWLRQAWHDECRPLVQAAVPVPTSARRTVRRGRAPPRLL